MFDVGSSLQTSLNVDASRLIEKDVRDLSFAVEFVNSNVHESQHQIGDGFGGLSLGLLARFTAHDLGDFQLQRTQGKRALDRSVRFVKEDRDVVRSGQRRHAMQPGFDLKNRNRNLKKMSLKMGIFLMNFVPLEIMDYYDSN